jgi:exonuclease III
MVYYRIDIMCLQETRALKAEYYDDEGFRVIMSGSEEGKSGWAGLEWVSLLPHGAHI